MKKPKIKLRKLKNKKKTMNRKDFIFETNKYTCNLQQFETIKSIAKNIFEGKIDLKMQMIIKIIYYLK